jgi:hypothetical protein
MVEMVTLTYWENEASLLVNSGQSYYKYKEVPWCIYKKLRVLLSQKREGEFWQLIKPYPLVERYGK